MASKPILEIAPSVVVGAGGFAGVIAVVVAGAGVVVVAAMTCVAPSEAMIRMGSSNLRIIDLRIGKMSAAEDRFAWDRGRHIGTGGGLG